mmetsp:Transcript_20110/g.27846  ORF Transcript_20110/g.27846 Transcript_20110/m.27846 type:complete len:106 (-) Transcript_20110:2021-2338(-)
MFYHFSNMNKILQNDHFHQVKIFKFIVNATWLKYNMSLTESLNGLEFSFHFLLLVLLRSGCGGKPLGAGTPVHTRFLPFCTAGGLLESSHGSQSSSAIPSLDLES